MIHHAFRVVLRSLARAERKREREKESQEREAKPHERGNVRFVHFNFIIPRDISRNALSRILMTSSLATAAYGTKGSQICPAYDTYPTKVAHRNPFARADMAERYLRAYRDAE